MFVTMTNYLLNKEVNPTIDLKKDLRLLGSQMFPMIREIREI